MVFAVGWDIKFQHFIWLRSNSSWCVTRSHPKLFHHVFVTILICFSLSSHALYAFFPPPLCPLKPILSQWKCSYCRLIFNWHRLWFSEHCFITTVSLCRNNILMLFGTRHFPVEFGFVCFTPEIRNELKLTWTNGQYSTLTHLIESSNKPKTNTKFFNQKFIYPISTSYLISKFLWLSPVSFFLFVSWNCSCFVVDSNWRTSFCSI